MLQWDYVSPYGMVRLFAEGGKLCRVALDGARGGGAARMVPRRCDQPLPFIEMLDRYFKGKDLVCDPVMLCLSGLSEFRQRVYKKLMEVGFGRVLSYGELARLSGIARSARAVGGALSANPLPLFIPCHRVVAAGGGLGGFGAGIEWKERLLRHEGWLVRGDRLCAADPHKTHAALSEVNAR